MPKLSLKMLREPFPRIEAKVSLWVVVKLSFEDESKILGKNNNFHLGWWVLQIKVLSQTKVFMCIAILNCSNEELCIFCLASQTATRGQGNGVIVQPWK